MTTGQPTESNIFTELPIRLYSALRTIRIYPPSNPQVTKSTDLVIAILSDLLEHEGKDITIASSDKTVLVNGTVLSEKDQQRPQIKGIADLYKKLQIHALTFHNGFSASDCVHFLQVLAAATSSLQPGQPLKTLLQDAGIPSVSVDEKRYVAVHEGEQVVPENAIGYGGDAFPINGENLAGYLRGKTLDPEAIGNLSTTALQQLFSSTVMGHSAVGQHSGGQNALNLLVDGLGETTAGKKQNELLDHSSTALAALTPALLSRLIAALPEKQSADTLLNKTIQRLDYNQLEALLLHLSTMSGSAGEKQREANSQHKEIIKKLRKSTRAADIEKATARLKDSITLAGLNRQPTPPHLREQLQQPDWSASVLVPALRYLAGQRQDKPTSELFTNLLSRYKLDLAPSIHRQVADLAGARLATLQDHELSRVLAQNFKGTFGEQLYGAIIEQVSDKQFEQIAQELNLLAQRKETSSPTDDRDQPNFLAAYNRLMQSVRGEALRAALSRHQETEDKTQQLDKEQILEYIKRLLSGDHGVLTDDLVIQTLPSSVIKLLRHDKTEAADKLLIQMITGLQQEDIEVRRGSAEVLGRTAESLVQHGEWQRLEKLLPALKQALSCAEDDQARSHALHAIELLIRWHLEQKKYNRAINALNPLFELTIHPDASSPGLLSQAQTCLARLCEPAVLDPLLENIQADSQYRENCWFLLSRMGAGAAYFLVERLRTSEDREEREQLLKLIGDIGKPARDALMLQLQQETPWYITRNIIRLLRNVGDADCFSTIAPYIHHEDQRVQQEVIQTLGAIGGAERKHFFLDELDQMPEELKPLVIRQLGKIHDQSIVLPLTDLLSSSAGPPQLKKEPLQTEICIALARIGSKKAVPTLNRIVQTKNIPGIEDYSPNVLAAAESALNAINADSRVLNDRTQQKSTVSHAQLTRKNDPLAVKETSIFRKAGRGLIEEAKKELYDLIVSCARQKDFANAERLRERIYEIDPMALTEIIRSGEIIEKEKTGAVSSDQLETWGQLLEKLNSVEFSAIYHELEERRFSPEEIIVRQGEKNDELYFINQGSVKISYKKDGRDIFVSSLNNGQIIGENFFNASVWTVTLTALTTVNISVLKRESFHRWQEAYPGLESKLLSFYSQCNTTDQLLKKKGLDRRGHDRFKLSRKIQIQLIDHNNKPIGRGFRGELVDISVGGLAFLIRISKRENTRLLLGRTMRITIPVGGDPEHLQLDGLAIGVQPFAVMESDFSVHIKFPDELDQETLQQILG